MQNEDKDCRRVAARALGQAGEGAKDAVPDLIQLLQDADEDNYVRWYTADALRQIGTIEALQTVKDFESR